MKYLVLTGILLAMVFFLFPNRAEKAAAGEGVSSPPPATTAAPEEPQLPGAALPPDLMLGEQTYRRACYKCHDRGITGAPRIGDRVAWSFHLSLGTGTLVRHCIQGRVGTRGITPPRGGDPTLSDKEVSAAVAYMLASLEEQDTR